MRDLIGFGVVGLGQGRAHLQVLQRLDGARVVALCDMDAALAAQVAAEDNVPAVYHNLDALLADSAVDAVVIATPDHLHGEQAIRTLLAEETRLGMLVGVAVGLQLARELRRHAASDPDQQED